MSMRMNAGLFLLIIRTSSGDDLLDSSWKGGHSETRPIILLDKVTFVLNVGNLSVPSIDEEDGRKEKRFLDGYLVKGSRGGPCEACDEGILDEWDSAGWEVLKGSPQCQGCS